MAEYELIQERLISGKGVLRVPTDKKKLRHYILYSDVIRLPKNAYINKNWNPDKGKYAFITMVRNEYVIAEIPIEYKRQSIDGIADIAGQTLIAVKCAYEGTLITLSNLGLSLGAPPLSYQDLIKDYENLNLAWDEIRVSCYADTALQLRLYRRNYDTCNADKDKQPPPPPPPPPLPPVPPGTPIADISPPYDRDDSDDGNSIPFEGDDVPPPPPAQPEACDICRVTVRAKAIPQGTTVTIVGHSGNGGVQYAPITSVQVSGPALNVLGGRMVGTGACGGESNIPVNYALNFAGSWENPEIINVEVVG